MIIFVIKNKWISLIILVIKNKRITFFFFVYISIYKNMNKK